MFIGVSTKGAGGASAPPGRKKSNLGGKDFIKAMAYNVTNGLSINKNK